MSKLISQLADVLEEIAKEKRKAGGFRTPPEMRKGAVSVVAEKYSVEERTVADGFIRRLRPEISSTAEFDEAVEHWIKGKPRKLRTALLKRIGDVPDAKRVFEALDSLPPRRRRH